MIRGGAIERVMQFLYSGRLLEDNDDDSHASLRCQLARARMKWNRIGLVLRIEGMKPISLQGNCTSHTFVQIGNMGSHGFPPQ